MKCADCNKNERELGSYCKECSNNKAKARRHIGPKGSAAWWARNKTNKITYLLVQEDGRFCKIGTSSNRHTLDKRIKQLQMGNPHELKLIMTCPYNIEYELHSHLIEDGLRYRGEWFFCGGTMLQHILNLFNEFRLNNVRNRPLAANGSS
jgi:hypothetical protein